MVKIENNQAFTTESDKKIYRIAQPTTFFSRCTLLNGESEKDFGEILTSEIPEPSTEPSAEEKRQEAYRAEADQYLIAYHGYMAEGQQLKADEQLKMYLAKKKEIRKRFAE